jgi:hypothetical protein
MEKLDPALISWTETKILQDGANYIDGRISIMLMVVGDPTLGGLIQPLGIVELMNEFSYVHTSISDLGELITLRENPAVIKIELDESYSGVKTSDEIVKYLSPAQEKIDLPDIDVIDHIVAPDTYASRELLGVQDVWKSGYDGTGVIVNVQDTGVDFGHTVYDGVMAKDADGNPLSLDPSGRMTISSFWSKEYWEYYGYSSPEFGPKFTFEEAGSTWIDVTGWENLIVYAPDLGSLFLVSDFGMDIPNLWEVGNIPGNATGFAYGLSVIHNGGWIELVPFLMADADGDEEYDTLYIDYETGYTITEAFFAETDIEYNIWMGRAPWDFSTAEAHTNTNNQELSADVRGPYEYNGVPDGYIDISLGGLGNSYDINEISNNEIPIVRGINPDGYVFAHIWDTGGHGTGCAGYIAAQPTMYAALNETSGHADETLFEMAGMAPGAKILATPGLSTSAIYYGWLWAAGFEPNENFIWTWNGFAHMANMSSNSWGTSSVKIGEIACGWDFETMFIDLLSTPDFIEAGYPGLLFLTSSGNGGSGMGTSKQPGQSTAALTIGASTTAWWRSVYGYNVTMEEQGDDQIIGWSDNGPSVIGYPKLDIVAPGAFDISFIPVVVGGDYEWTDYYFINIFGGTSASCPVVAGAAALMYQAYAETSGQLSPDLAKVLLKSSAIDLGYDTFMQGTGRVSALGAVELANGTTNAIYAYSEDAARIAGERYAAAYFKYFDRNSYLGTDELPDVAPLSLYNETPLLTEGMIDNAAYFGALFPGGSEMNKISIVGNISDVTVNAVTMKTIYSAVNDSIDLITQDLETSSDFINGGYYPIRLADLFDLTEIQAGEYIQLTFGQTLENYNVYDADGIRQPIMYITHLVNGDPFDGTAIWGFDNYAYGHGNFQTVFLPSSHLDDATYVRIRDYNFAADNTWTGLPFYMGLRVFERAVDADITIEMGTDHFNATIDIPVDSIGGIYEGYFVIAGGLQDVLVPYGYSIVTAVTAYENDGWTTITDGTLTNRPNDNGFYGSYDYSWRPETGDWRYYDIYLDWSLYDKTDMMALAIELEWENPGTEVNMWVVDYGGRIVMQTDYLTSAGEYISDVNAPPTKQLLISSIYGYAVEDYLDGGWAEDVTTGLGYDLFTIIIHANKMNPTPSTLPLEPFTLRATWTINSYNNNFDQPYAEVTNGVLVGDTYYAKENIAITWSDVSTNPIQDFVNDLYPTELALSPASVIKYSGRILAEDVVEYSGTIVEEYSHEVFLQAGDYVVADLDWDDPAIDYDFLLIPDGYPVSFENCYFNAAGGSSNKPEHFEGMIDQEGLYHIIVEYFDGPGTGQDSDFEMVFSIIGDPIYNSQGEAGEAMTFNFKETGQDNGLYIISSSSGGWNFDRAFNGKVIYDSSVPLIETEIVDTTIDFTASLDLLWNITDDNAGTYEVLIDSVIALEGEFVGEDQVNYIFEGTTEGEFNILLIVTDHAGNSFSDEVVITVNREPGIFGYGGMTFALLSVATLITLRKKIRK